MKIKELIDELKTYSSQPFDVTCDTVKCGDTEREIAGVGVAMFATPEVIRKAKEANINFLIVHEPLCYNHMDTSVPFPVGQEKRDLLAEYGIAVFRFHDFAHNMNPDLIYEGQLKMMGIPGTPEKGKYFAVNRYILNEPMTAKNLAKKLESALGIKHIRIAGCTDKEGTNISCCFGTPGHVAEELSETDFVLTGEICEWCEGELARDMAQMGYNKAILVMGHIGSEYGGMKLLADMISEKHAEFPTQYINCGEVYSYTD